MGHITYIAHAAHAAHITFKVHTHTRTHTLIVNNNNNNNNNNNSMSLEGSSFDKFMCNRCGQVRPPSSSYQERPQNRYLAHLVDELEKCSQSSNELSRLEKDFVSTRRDMSELQRELKELKGERSLQNDKVSVLHKDMAEHKLLHLQLTEEVSNEFRQLYHKQRTRDKDADMLKYIYIYIFHT